jgi:PHP family Zn ribbon phosphoesterase
LSAVVGENVADAVVRVRDGRVKVVPGYDGVYGRMVFSEADAGQVSVPRRVQQRNLSDFF